MAQDCQTLLKVTEILARISPRITAATAQCGALTGVHSVRRLDVESTMPARPSVANASHRTTLSGLATRPGEKSGLAMPDKFFPNQVHRYHG